MALFTVETARIAGLRSVEAKKAAKLRLLNAPPLVQANPQPTVDNDTTTTDPAKLAALARVLRQLDRIDLLLEDADDAKEWDMLTRAKERLAKVWFHLGGIAGPGQLRPVAPAKPRRSYSAPSPGPIPEPVQAPDTTTGSVPSADNNDQSPK